MLDLGPERPGQASETREMGELDRARIPAKLSGKYFWPALVVIVAILVAVSLLR